MPVQHSPPATNTRSQRHQAVLTPTERAPLSHTPSVNQVSSNLDIGPPMEGEAPSRRGGVKLRRSRLLSLACWVAIQAFLKGLGEAQGKLKIERRSQRKLK
ncbi:hypothetical protein O181_074516 [Austropuccinia psidii MF-1]|uniref:Uncharacterized protein n=1 Tax=Austropuccinia psidii MF-1 TaxID=1389203 RepID=A0A9Q3FD07_9BASI|nr:hypothetical protein [Austropuccinia psidii MF-1]